MVPENLRYTEQHEWVDRTASGTFRIGITDYAQQQLGDVVFVQLPGIGDHVGPGQPLGEVESTKSVSDVYAPVAGEVVAANAQLTDTPELINSDPYGAGWMIELQPDDPAAANDLLDAQGYQSLLPTS